MIGCESSTEPRFINWRCHPGVPVRTGTERWEIVAVSSVTVREHLLRAEKFGCSWNGPKAVLLQR